MLFGRRPFANKQDDFSSRVRSYARISFRPQSQLQVNRVDSASGRRLPHCLHKPTSPTTRVRSRWANSRRLETLLSALLSVDDQWLKGMTLFGSLDKS